MASNSRRTGDIIHGRDGTKYVVLQVRRSWIPKIRAERESLVVYPVPTRLQKNTPDPGWQKPDPSPECPNCTTATELEEAPHPDVLTLYD